MRGILTSAVIFLLISGCLFAQTTGKLSGTITDKSTGEPLTGVNVFLEGTNMGTASGSDGSYFILNVPPGNYNVVMQYMGYKKLINEGIQISVNRTSNVSAALEQTVVEGEEVVVIADRIAIKKDQTSSIRNVSADNIGILPIENTSDVVALQPGVVDGHMRGGRLNETSYLVDGISIYDGLNRGRLIEVDPDAVQEVEVITGTFSAKYGEAMGGVVNMVTKEGSKAFHGKFEGYLGNYYTTHDDIYIGLKPGEVTRNQDYRVILDGPIYKDRITFFVNARVQNNDNCLNGIRRFNVTDQPNYSIYEVDENGNETFPFNMHTGDGEYVPMDWRDSFNLNGKLTYNLRSLKMSLMYLSNSEQSQGYVHDKKYRPDGKSTRHDDTYMITYNLNQVISKRAFYELKLSYLNTYVGTYLYKNPTDSRYINDNYLINANETGFYTGGQDKGHDETTTEKYLGRLDLTWQVTNSHSLESGLEATLYRYDRQNLDIRNAFEYTAAEAILYEPVVLPDSTRYSDIYYKKPEQYAAWISDKMEYKDMVIELGARAEYFDPKTIYPSNYRNPADDPYPDESQRTTYLKADAQYHIAPRLGFSYKIGSMALLRFSYGHFYQYPPHSTLYLNHAYVIVPTNYSSYVGNPNVRPEKTVNYEIGLWQVLNKYMDLEIALWYKDIYDLSTANIFTTYNQVRYGLYGNKDYGNARGLELKFHTEVGAFYGEVNYTLQYTRGNADNPTFTFTRAGASADPVPVLIPMPWDQRHTLNMTAGYNTPKYGATLTGYMGSGLAYTWSPISENPINRVNLYPNNSKRPYTYNMDLQAHYNFPKVKGVNLRLMLYVYNLLDHLNEDVVNGNTGRTNQAIIKESDRAIHHSDFSTYEERLYSPANWSDPRLVKLGLGIVF